MTEKQVFNNITSEKKWFEDYCTPSYATEMKQKFRAGLLGEKAIERLFEHFGYTIKTEAQWEKKQYCQCDFPIIRNGEYCGNCEKDIK